MSNFDTFLAWIEEAASEIEDNEEDKERTDLIVRGCNVCARCGEHVDIDSLNDEALCEVCAATVARGYGINRLTGRLRNGAERDGGTLWHAILLSDDGKAGHKAVCGATPGPRSVGWGMYPRREGVTCTRCIAKLLRKGMEVT